MSKKRVGGVVTLGTDIVIDDNGSKLRMIAANPGTVLTDVGRKQFPQRGREQSLGVSNEKLLSAIA